MPQFNKCISPRHQFMPIHRPAEIVTWLSVNEAPMRSGYGPPSLQFSSITTASFRALFRRLVALAKLDYVFARSDVTQGAENWQSEFRTALDALSFPFQIDSSWVLKPSKAYVWPFLLSICEWLVKKRKVRIGAHVYEHRALSHHLVDAFPLEFGYGNGEFRHTILSAANYEGLKLT